MNIILATTRASLEENERILVEARNLGHNAEMVDLKDFEYVVKNNKLHISQLEDKNPDVIILRGIFNSVKAIATYMRGLRKKGIKIFDNNFLDHIYSINKISDIIKLSQADVPIPDSAHLHFFDKFVPTAEEIGYPVICKLTRTGKGAGVYKFDNKKDLEAFVNDLSERGSEPRSYMLQKFVDYEHDLRILIVGKEMFCMKRIPGDGEFRANFSLGGSVEVFELDEKGKKLARKALRAVNLKIGGVDMLISKNGNRSILEVNHTAGFIGMELATSTNIGKTWVEYAIANAK